MEKIQVCAYTGKYPNHKELDNEFVSSKAEALAMVVRWSHQDALKGGDILNFRIVDFMNRFKPIFIEQE